MRLASIDLHVTGMDCAHCAAKIEDSVRDITGVTNAELVFINESLDVQYDKDMVDVQKIISTIERLGYSASTKKDHPEVILSIEGMDCGDEVTIIEKKLYAVNGVIDYQINLAAAQVSIKYDPALCSITDLIKAIAETGMRAQPKLESNKSARNQWMRNTQFISLVISSGLLLAGLICELFGVLPLIPKILFGGSILIGAFYPARMGILALLTFTINIRLLMVIGALGAIALGLWEEAALLVVIYSLGDVLESFTVARARNSIKSLLDIAPKEALIKRSGQEMTVPVEELRVGDTLVVRPGEKIAADGDVTWGDSYVDESVITGEPIATHKTLNAKVFAGTINQQGTLEVTIKNKVSDSTLSKIIRSVEQAQANKSTFQRFGDRFAKIYTPFMLVLGISVACIPPLFMGGDWNTHIYRGLVMFVVSCSCGIALSVPIAVLAATGNAARHGVLFRGGSILEAFAETKVFIFDKTGTLTIGRPQVTDVIPLNGLDKMGLLRLAALIESKSEHPIAQAIVRKAKEQNISLDQPLDGFLAVTGKGIEAQIGDKEYLLGNSQLLLDNRIDMELAGKHETKLESEGKTVVHLSENGSLIGMLAVADTIRTDSISGINRLKAMEIQLTMLTGDNRGSATEVARRLGLDDFKANLLPLDKVEALKLYATKYGRTAMVGDGINDAPAMATADISIAMGAAGTDIAIETADILLMSDNLLKIDYALRLSKRSVRMIKQNILISLTIVAILIPTALLGWIGLLPGLLLNEGGALIVIFNALRLMKNLDE